MDVTAKDDMIAEARDGLERGMQVRLLLGGSWVQINKLVRLAEVQLLRAQGPDGTMILFEEKDLIAVSFKGD